MSIYRHKYEFFYLVTKLNNNVDSCNFFCAKIEAINAVFFHSKFLPTSLSAHGEATDGIPKDHTRHVDGV